MSYPSYSKKKEFDQFVEDFDFSDRDQIVKFFDENKERFLAAHEGLFDKKYKSSSPKLRNCLIELIHWSKKGRSIYLETMKTLEANKDEPKKSGKKAKDKNIIEELPKKIPTGTFPDDELELDSTVTFH